MAMEDLPPPQRAVLLLREVEGLSYQEIAEVIGCALGTVMSRLHYARRHLRERLRPFLKE
jgi:RNA polymerase sigma-70 factor (ECF subfamily)